MDTKQNTTTDEETNADATADTSNPNTETDADTDGMSQAAVQVTSQSGNDERGTPIEFVRQLQNAIGGKFDLDPCSGAEPQPIAHTRFTKEDNGLAQDWSGHETVYVNPPYSDLGNWLKKIHRETTRQSPDAPGLVFALLPGNTSTQWFQNHATAADYLCLIEGRLKFHGTDHSAPFASILLVFGDPDDSVLKTLNTLGTTYTRTEIEDASRQSRLDELIETDGGISAATASASSAPPTPGLNPADSLGKTIRDLSKNAPAVPQGIIDLNDVNIGDRMFIKFETTPMGVPHAAPDQVTATVQSGEPATERETGTPSEWKTVTMIDEEKDVYITLLQNPENPHQIECSVSIDGGPWRNSPINTWNRVAAGTLPALEPYGKGTSYVC